MAFCFKCGKKLPDGAMFCPACGTKQCEEEIEERTEEGRPEEEKDRPAVPEEEKEEAEPDEPEEDDEEEEGEEEYEDEEEDEEDSGDEEEIPGIETAPSASAPTDPATDPYFDDILPEIENELYRLPKEIFIKIGFGVLSLILVIAWLIWWI